MQAIAHAPQPTLRSANTKRESPSSPTMRNAGCTGERQRRPAPALFSVNMR
jgi:hypothetical protein